MAKITTIIDIGSNSMRMVVLKKTSRFAFHLINESKSKVKISEGSYRHGGVLQEIPMQRAFSALKSFLNISKSLKSRKILCVATSALRDAPNKKELLTKVSKELKLNIKIIDGPKEAYFGAVAALNLLHLKSFVTLDIGGGSTEFSIVKDKHIIDTISLDIGTVRIDELFLKNGDFQGAKEYIISQIKLYEKSFSSNIDIFNTIVGLGGTLRAVARSIIKTIKYPLDILHGFEYEVEKNISLLNKIISVSNKKDLKKLGIRKDRFDTIIAGVFIFKTILEYFSVKKVVTSGVGVREGVYLCDLLRNSNHKFPANFNVSVRSLLDRFVDDKTQSAYLGNNAKKLFKVLEPLHKLDKKYMSILVIASKLQLVGISLDFYKSSQNTFMFILNGLNYGFSHQDKLLISFISKFTKKSLPKKDDLLPFIDLLPPLEVIQWLNFMMSLNMLLNIEFLKVDYNYILKDNILEISSQVENYLIKDDIKRLETPLEVQSIKIK